MIAARLPPYSHIVKRDQGRLERVAVDEDFITQIREMPAEDLTAIFHGAIGRSGPPGNRHVEPDGADQPSHKTHAIRKELRMLKINLVIEEFYNATEDVEQARQRAQEFLRSRLKSLYPDMSREETAKLQRRGEEIVQRVEEKVLAECAARKAAQPKEDAAQPKGATMTRTRSAMTNERRVCRSCASR